MTVVRTERLVLRPFRLADVPAYQAIRLKPGVTRFLPSHTEDPEEAARRAAATVEAFMAAWARDGYGPWAVEAAGILVGHLGLRWLPEMTETELLFLLDPRHQGRGYATEGGRAALDHGFGTLGLSLIAAYALPENAASVRVLEALGMTRIPGLSEAFGLKVIRFEARPGAY